MTPTDEPMVYICVRHRVWSYIPLVQRWLQFHFHMSKPLRNYNSVDLQLFRPGGDAYLGRWWKVEVRRDRWPHEQT